MNRSHRKGISTKMITRLLLWSCAAWLAACGPALAQTLPPAPASSRNAAPLQDDSVLRQRRPETDTDKNSRVAASPEQIRVVLVKNPGLFVELERIAEREAIAKGQLVEDSDLTQEAIFERLDDDVPFRATATRLLQRYGYLLPTVNPESELGVEEQLVIRERARRIVQTEAQEDAMNSAGTAQIPSLASTDNCDPNTNPDCKPATPKRRSRNVDDFNPEPNALPEGPSTIVPPGLLPAMPGSPLMQTGFSGGGSRLGGGGSDSDASNVDLLRMLAMSGGGVPGSSALPSQSAGLDQYLAKSGLSGANLSDLLSHAGAPDNKTSAPVSPAVKTTRLATKNSSSDPLLGNIVRKDNPFSDVPSLLDLYVQVSANDKAPERFGVNILSSGDLDSNAVPMDLPVGPDYVVGPGDGLAIDLWGGMAQRLQRTVDREGRISLPEYGPVLVSGKSLENVQLTIQQLLRTQLRNVSIDVSLSKLRTVRVYVVGEVAQPGAYDISSLSSPLNAVVAAGGLTDRGSLRQIKHYRGKQLVEVVDAYDLLLRGAGPEELRLENGDSLMVPPVGPQVTIEGMVRRPAIYELRGNTSLEDALELAGGMLPAAALKHVEVERLVAHENRTMLSLDLSEKDNPETAAAQLRNFQIQDGDRIHIFPIAPYNEQSIYLQGHVLRPGRYSYKQGMTVRDVVASYADLLPEPSAKYAEIIRLNPPDFRPTVESFDLSAALSDGGNAPQLKPLDTVRIFSRYDFESAPTVWVDGEVRTPGKYTTSGQARLRDAIYLAGGPTPDADLNSVQIFRSNKDGTMKVLSVDLEDALAGQPHDDLLLQPRDRVVVHRNPVKVEPYTVYVKGDVENPGRYPLTSDMRVEDLVHAAGGLKPSADSQSALLAHREEPDAAIESLKVNVSAAMSGNADENKTLTNGDVLTIPKNPSWSHLGTTVTIRGEVRHPGTYGIRPGESLNSVLAKAGGFTPEAFPYGIVLTRKEVRDLEMKAHEDLVDRLKIAQMDLKTLPENDQDQKNLKITAVSQTQTTLTQLETHLPVGRVVLQGTSEKSFARGAGQTALQSGDTILVPKKPNYVVVQGQVYNGTAVAYVPGRSANWYLSQAGGFTALADRKGVFVIRADGSVISSKNNHPALSGDPMNAELRAGDMVVVPERAPKLEVRNWQPLIQTAQVATSVALAVAYIHP